MSKPIALSKMVYTLFCMSTLALAAPSTMAQSKAEAERTIKRQHPGLRMSKRGQRTTTLYGVPFGSGSSPQETADSFRRQHTRVLDAAPEDLVARGRLADGRHTQPLMYDADTGQYKFTLVHYSQQRGGIPVYGADVRLLVRNEPGFPLVLASNGLRNLGSFVVDANAPRDAAKGAQAARQAHPKMINTTQPQLVIWAGVDDDVTAPRLAFTFEGDNGLQAGNAPLRRKLVCDAVTGEILHDESMIHHLDVQGSVSGQVTQGIATDSCEEEALEALPYARVNIGATQVFADEFGNFTIPNAGTDPVTVQSPVRGQYFRVENSAGANSVLSMNVNPPGPADFEHNAANNSGTARAEANIYLEANVVRDYVLSYNPAYPVIATQNEFLINANVSGGFCPCNAWYSGDSMSFCVQSGSCPNMGFSVIVHHEYGHHLVAVAGSGQGAYGEGSGDLIGQLIADDPNNGLGVFGGCNDPARTGDNNIQYPCNGGSHTCGQLLTGCAWSTRNELIVTEPDDYRDILSSIAINATLLHIGTAINPDITVHYLTLDDDDATLENGSPHYFEINAGFGAHNMAVNTFPALVLSFPQGRPDYSDPDDGTAVVVQIDSGTGTLDESMAPMLHVSVNGGPFTETPLILQEEKLNTFEGTLPAAECFDKLEWYVSAEATSTEVVTSPSDAPTDTYGTLVASVLTTIASFDFESDPGFSASGTATGGQWELGVPLDCGAGDPPTDFDGSGQCWLTGNTCNDDIDNGLSILTSHSLDMGNPDVQYVVSYARWFSNGVGNTQDAMVVRVSKDNGSNWSTLDIVSSTSPEAQGGWYEVSHSINDIFTPTANMRLRFQATDVGADSVVEVAVDALRVQALSCAAPCTSIADCADLDDNGIRDDGCTFWECADGACAQTEVAYADMGGGNGACSPDGTADSNDRFHALNCFSNQTTTGDTGYLCEAAPPAAFNVDVAGLKAPCAPDGVCDANDAFAALNAFSNNSTCTCDSGPAPDGPSGGSPERSAPQSVTVRLIPSQRSAAPGDIVDVDVVLADALQDVRGYQLHVSAERADSESSRSERGLQLIDMFVDDRDTHVFKGLPYWDAYNIDTQQLLAGLDADGVATTAGAYVATLRYRVPQDARGVHKIDLRGGSEPTAGRTAFFATLEGTTIDLAGTEPAQITIQARRRAQR